MAKNTGFQKIKLLGRIAYAALAITGGQVLCGTDAQAQDVSPSGSSAIEALSGLSSWADLPDDYVSKVTDRAAAMVSGLSDIGGHLLTVVDRSKSQAIIIYMVSPDRENWSVAYQGHVSTGKPGRREHFLTPVGVFEIDGSILDYRAEGTFNDNHIRGIGLKGSRVWDMGWQETEDWRHPGATARIRMEMHATDPANLEKRIGRPDSEGCIRIHADLNAVMDTYGVLDAAPGQMAQNGDARWQYVLGKSHVFTPEAGRYLVILDMGQTG